MVESTSTKFAINLVKKGNLKDAKVIIFNQEELMKLTRKEMF